MKKLATVSGAALREALADASTGKAAKRAVVALAYKDGVSVETLSERYGIPRSTVYHWLDRFEDVPVAEAVRDERRPGRPPELSEEGRDDLRTDLAHSPRVFGFDADAWSPELVRAHMAKAYSVEYSLGHVRRILRSAEFESPSP